MCTYIVFVSNVIFHGNFKGRWRLYVGDIKENERLWESRFCATKRIWIDWVCDMTPGYVMCAPQSEMPLYWQQQWRWRYVIEAVAMANGIIGDLMLYRSQSFMGQKSWMKIWFYASTIFFFSLSLHIPSNVTGTMLLIQTLECNWQSTFFFYLSMNFEIYLDCSVLCKIDFESETNTFFAMIETNTQRRLKNTRNFYMCAVQLTIFVVEMHIYLNNFFDYTCLSNFYILYICNEVYVFHKWT